VLVVTDSLNPGQAAISVASESLVRVNKPEALLMIHGSRLSHASHQFKLGPLTAMQNNV
jgi:hypothetical protein